jgi:hypothetical protein
MLIPALHLAGYDVALRIKSHGTTPSDAIHQQDWFWVREFYDCEVITIS